MASPSPRASGAQASPAPSPPRNMVSAGPARVPPPSPIVVVLQPSAAPSLLSAEGGALSIVVVDAVGFPNANPDQEALTGAGSVPLSPASRASLVEAEATPNTPATPEGLGGELVVTRHSCDELAFEKCQHELEVEAWSRKRRSRQTPCRVRGHSWMPARRGSGSSSLS